MVAKIKQPKNTKNISCAFKTKNNFTKILVWCRVDAISYTRKIILTITIPVGIISQKDKPKNISSEVSKILTDKQKNRSNAFLKPSLFPVPMAHM